ADEGIAKSIVHREAAGYQDIGDGGAKLLSPDRIEAGVTLPLEKVPEHHLPPGLPIVESLDGHGVGENPRRRELIAGMRHRQTCSGLMYFHPPRPCQSHHPDVARAGGEEILDFRSQRALVLA